jgi:tape measure domain-containing protein
MAYTAGGPGAVISVSVEGVAASQRQIDSMAQSMNNLSSTVQGAMRNLAATVGLGGGIAELVQASDQYTKLTSQLKLATDSTRAYAAAYADVKRIATAAQADLSGTGVLYARIANGTRELGISQQRVADITEVVNLALKASGASAQEAASAQSQLSQAFAAGALRGQDFNSVNEAAPRLMRALADGMGVPIGALRQMAEEGKITSQIMSDVLPRSLEQLRQEAGQVQTIGGAFTVLKNTVMEFTATNAQSNGAVAALTGSISLLTNNLGVLAGTLTTVTLAKTVSWFQNLTVETYRKAAADQAARTATLAAAQADLTRVQATGAQAAATQVAIVTAREEMVARLAQANANVLAARAAIEAATAVGAQSFALRTLRIATSELAAAEAGRAAALAELALLGQQQVRLSAEIAAARTAEAAATRAASVAQAGASLGAGLAGRAVGLLGGPVGALITVLGLAATAWSVWGNKAQQSTAQAAESYEEAHKRIVKGLDEQIAKNERLVQLQNLGMTKPEIDRNAPVLAQIEAASKRIDDINNRAGEFASMSNNDVFFARTRAMNEIVELTGKMQKADAAYNAAAGASPQAQALIAVRERLAGVDKQYLEDLQALQAARERGAVGEKEYASLVSQLANEEYKKSDAGKAALAAKAKETEAYAELIAGIREKIEANRLELATGEDTTTSQKLHIKLDQELAAGKLKLAPAHLALAQAKLFELGVTEQALKLDAAQRDVTKYIAESTAARDKDSASLAVQYQMYGKTADAREVAMVSVQAEIWKEAELAKLRADKKPITDQIIAQLDAEAKARTLVGEATLGQSKALQYATQLADDNKKFGLEYIVDEKERVRASLALEDDMWRERIRLAGDGTEAQKLLQQNYDTWYRNQLAKPELDAQKKMWQSVEQTAHDTFISIFDSGKSAFDRLRDSLKNGLLDLLYQLTLKRWIINIGASIGMGGAGGLAQAAGIPIGDVSATGSATGAVPLIGAANMASNLYKAVSGGFSGIGASIGQGVTYGGNLIGADSIAAFGKGMQGFGLDGSLGQAAGYGQMAGTAAGYGAGLLGGHYIGNAISGDYSLGNHGQAVVNTASIVGAVVGGPIGAAIGGAIGGLINRAFGMGKTDVTSAGMRGTLSAAGLTGKDYQNLHQDGGWFRSDKNWTAETDFSADIVKQFSQGFDAIKATSSKFAAALSQDASALDSYSKKFDIALGKDQAANQKAITDFFTGLGDEIATMLVPNLDKFTKSGESAAAALQRLAGDFDATNQVAQLLGKSASTVFGSVGIGSAEARERLIELAGGVQALGQQASFYAQNFLTDAERLKPVQEALDAAMASLGLSSIQTREAFKDHIDQLIASGALLTESGAKEFAAMMNLEEAFTLAHPAIVDNTQALLEQAAAQKAAAEAARVAAAEAAQQAMRDQATSLLGSVDSAFSVLQAVANREKAAIQSSISAHTAAANQLMSLSQALHGTLDGMRLPDQAAYDRLAAQAQIRTALAISKAGGPLPDAAALQKALGIVAQDASGQFASYQDYQRDYYSTKNDIADLAGLTDSSLSLEQQTLTTLNAQLASVDAVLMAAQSEVEQLKGQSTTQLSMLQALEGIRTAILAAQANPVVATASAVNSTYQKALGRAPDAAGLAYWQQQAASGVSLDAITSAISTSPEATIQGMYQTMMGRSADAAGLNFWLGQLGKGVSMGDIANAIGGSAEVTKLHPFAVGTNYVQETMPALIHEGERIMPAADNRQLMARLASPAGNSEALVQEFRALRTEVSKLRKDNSAENLAIAKHSMKAANALDDAVNGERPLTTSVSS